MTRRTWALWTALALGTLLLVWHNEQRVWADCRARFSVTECAELLNR